MPIILIALIGGLVVAPAVAIYYWRSPAAQRPRLRSSDLQVGLAMGLFFVVVGFTSGNYGIVGLGVVVFLVGFFSRNHA